ncbi:MAG: universal stress protein [Candidatus Methylomirabilales bacterium]
MIDTKPDSYELAVRDFRWARRKAALKDLFGRLLGDRPDLMPYEEVRQRLHGRELPGWKLQEIPLDAIVGSVGRYRDFTRGFLPRQDSDLSRWARVELAVLGSSSLPPIQAYRIGDAYFVLDGNHRVSVARQLGADRVQAMVKEVQTKVPLSPDDRLDEVILKAEQTEFLEYTHLDEIRPEADITLTVPGRFQYLQQQIEAHRELISPNESTQVPLEEAVGRWYDEVYLPTLQVIRRRGLLREFPGRTQADLYVWISQHLVELRESLGWEVRPEAAATDLAEHAGQTLQRVTSRIRDAIVNLLRPETFNPGPAVGEWRQQVVASRGATRFALDVLVALSGEDFAWPALDQALLVAKKEEARVLGLHVVSGEVQNGGASVRAEFELRAKAAGVAHEFAVESGKVPRTVCRRARWTDLVVLSLAHPPGPGARARLGSGFRDLIQRCPRPILAVPGQTSPLARGLLAYDGSRKADEALFLATYLAARWGMSLVIATVREGRRVTDTTVDRARKYAERYGVYPSVRMTAGDVAPSLLEIGRDEACDLFIMGGYGFAPVLEVVLGSAVDQVLRETAHPVLISR